MKQINYWENKKNVMKKIYLLICIITIFSFLTSSLKSSENKILVKVNNQIITSLDIASEIKYLEL